MKNMLPLFALGLLTLLNSCKRDEVQTVGPALCPEASFHNAGTIVIPETIDFLIGDKKIHIQETLSEPVAWTLTIKGLSSGAEKEFKGTGTDIDLTWYGEPGGDVFFTKEDCNVSISVPCLNTVFSKKVKITQTSDFSAMSYPMWNFEDASTNPIAYPAANVDFTKGLYNFPSAPALITPSPQGGGYFNFTAALTDPTTTTFYFGGMDGVVSGNTAKAIVAKTSSDPSRVYFNCYVNTNGKPSMVYFQIKEKDPANPSTLIVRPFQSFSGSGLGWKHISFKLSDAKVADVNNIRQINAVFQAAPNAASECEVNLDMPIFTLDKPFFDN